MTEAPPPPAHLAPYVRILGHEGAMEFFLRFGGSEVYFPATQRGRSRLVEAVGEERAAALAAAIGHLKARIPTAKPWLAQALHAKGLPTAEIGRRLHMTDVSVRRWLRAGSGIGAAQGDPRQLPLI